MVKKCTIRLTGPDGRREAAEKRAVRTMREKIHGLRISGENSVFRKTLKKGIASSLIPLLLMGVCIFAIDTNRSQEQLGEITLSMMEKNDQIVQYLLEDVERGARNLTLSPRPWWTSPCVPGRWMWSGTPISAAR